MRDIDEREAARRHPARAEALESARLRGKFLEATLDLPGVETVRGVGYRFREPGNGRP